MQSRNFTLFLRFALTFSIRKIERVPALESGARVGRDWGIHFLWALPYPRPRGRKVLVHACPLGPVPRLPARPAGHPWRRQCH